MHQYLICWDTLIRRFLSLLGILGIGDYLPRRELNPPLLLILGLASPEIFTTLFYTVSTLLSALKSPGITVVSPEVSPLILAIPLPPTVISLAKISIPFTSHHAPL